MYRGTALLLLNPYFDDDQSSSQAVGGELMMMMMIEDRQWVRTALIADVLSCRVGCSADLFGSFIRTLIDGLFDSALPIPSHHSVATDPIDPSMNCCSKTALKKSR